MTRLAILFLIAACGPREVSLGPGDDPTPTDDTGVVVDTSPVLKTVDQVRFRAFIAWDAERQQIVNPIIDGGDFISAYVITVGVTGYDANDEDTYCKVVVNLADYTMATTAVDEGYLWGVNVPQGRGGITEDCIDKGWDPAEFEGDPIADWGGRDWHLRMGGDPGTQLTDWLTPADPGVDFDINRYTGGTWWTDTGGLSGGDDDVYWYGYEMDPVTGVNYDVQYYRDNLTNDSGGLRTGYYVMGMSAYWNFAD